MKEKRSIAILKRKGKWLKRTRYFVNLKEKNPRIISSILYNDVWLSNPLRISKLINNSWKNCINTLFVVNTIDTNSMLILSASILYNPVSSIMRSVLLISTFNCAKHYKVILEITKTFIEIEKWNWKRVRVLCNLVCYSFVLFLSTCCERQIFWMWIEFNAEYAVCFCDKPAMMESKFML